MARSRPPRELQATVSTLFSGPLPPPAALERYAAVIPNGTDRIMAFAERQADHRHALEAATVHGNVRAQARGQHYALIVVLAGMVCGTALIAMGRSAEGLASTLVPLAAAAGLFIYTRRAQDKERAKKVRDIDSAALPPSS